MIVTEPIAVRHLTQKAFQVMEDGDKGHTVKLSARKFAKRSPYLVSPPTVPVVPTGTGTHRSVHLKYCTPLNQFPQLSLHPSIYDVCRHHLFCPAVASNEHRRHN